MLMNWTSQIWPPKLFIGHNCTYLCVCCTDGLKVWMNFSNQACWEKATCLGSFWILKHYLLYYLKTSCIGSQVKSNKHHLPKSLLKFYYVTNSLFSFILELRYNPSKYGILSLCVNPASDCQPIQGGPCLSYGSCDRLQLHCNSDRIR